MTDRLSVFAGLLLALLFFVFIHYGKLESSSVAMGAETEQEDAPIVQAIIDQEEPTVAYELTADERDLVERVVMGESGGEEYIGQQAVAQCILNACYITGNRPAGVIDSLQYTSHRPDPTQSVKNAVASVFDDGEKVISEAAMYFYAPDLVTSEWHESQTYICTIGCHKFFERRS